MTRPEHNIGAFVGRVKSKIRLFIFTDPSLLKAISKITSYYTLSRPNFRDGLLRGDIEDLEEGDSIFHNSPHDYYQNRPEVSDEIDVDYDEEEKENMLELFYSLSLRACLT